MWEAEAKFPPYTYIVEEGEKNIRGKMVVAQHLDLKIHTHTHISYTYKTQTIKIEELKIYKLARSLNLSTIILMCLA